MSGPAQLYTRAYQLEMFEHSMKANTIVVMETGTGKTHVAGLRIEAELKRTPTKQVWFTAPTKPLVQQQLDFLSSQLPGYKIKCLTGDDDVDTWGDATIWEHVLKDVNVVVATPRVLYDALCNDRVRLQNISLLVFDEAHHCRAKSDSALIMKSFYHPRKARTPVNLPHVLGLTASPWISDKLYCMGQLERNLDASCRSPTRSIDEYAQHAFKAVVVRRLFSYAQLQISTLLRRLGEIVSATRIEDDPYYTSLLKAGDDLVAQKLKKVKRSGQTPAIKELRRLHNNAQDLHDNLGPWAADRYIQHQIMQSRNKGLDSNLYHKSAIPKPQVFINQKLDPLHDLFKNLHAPLDTQISSKALELTRYLISEYRRDIAIIVFVERKSTAWALCELLKANASLKDYGIFSYVGSSTTKSGLHGRSIIKAQETAFSGFRDGSQNLCIATSVVEEGIDVQAVNIVIRYDDPKQIRSFLQSRGRARQPDSKIVFFEADNAEPGKYETWEQIEKAMEERCRKAENIYQARLEIERKEEDGGEIYRVGDGEGLLDLNNSVPRLAHFCAKSARSADPIYILDGMVGFAVSAEVRLPSSVPPQLRRAYSCRTWVSEKMAKRDAAFHAVKALHRAGLIDDHLMPIIETKTLDPLVHDRQMKVVPGEHQVWMAPDPSVKPSAYRIQVSHRDGPYLSLVMLLPNILSETLRFTLMESVLRPTQVCIEPLGRVDLDDCEYAEKLEHAKIITKALFEAAFREGTASRSLADPSRLSCLLIPECDDAQLTMHPARLHEFLHYHGWLHDLQPLLIWTPTILHPFLWYPPHAIETNARGKLVLKAKPFRRLRIFNSAINCGPGRGPMPQNKELNMEDCQTRGIATVYGPVALFLPSIIHLFAAALRAQHAVGSVLKPIGFSSAEFVVPALIAKSAAGTYNYERLEFLGDACLKYFASIQMFFDYPNAMEGVLTRKTHEIIGNTRLEEATNKLGLARFITTKAPVQKRWEMPKTKDEVPEETRNVVSKTLADVVESILGAAYLDGQRKGQTSERCLATLRLFIPEIEWTSPQTHIRRYFQASETIPEKSHLQRLIERMLGYDFKNPELLVEALTHSTDDLSQPDLDRLEFLGDAILDQIIKVRLFKYPELDAGRLTVCRHALASHAYLAFCALGIQCNDESRDVDEDEAGKIIKIIRTNSVGLMNLVKFRDTSPWEQVIAAKKNYETIRECIESDLRAGRFPWTRLQSLDAPKICSDVIESLLAAVYLDTQGSLETCQMVVQTLGITDLLERVAQNNNFEVHTPIVRLNELCAEKKIRVQITALREQDGNTTRWVGEVRLEGNVSITRAASCFEEARSCVSEATLDFLFAMQGQSSPNQGQNQSQVDGPGDVVMSRPDGNDRELREGNSDGERQNDSWMF